MFLTLAAALTVASPATAADPLEPAREGKLMCVTPNVAAKTCEGIATYSFGADGSITNESRTAVSSAPPIFLLTRTTMTLRGEAECSSTANFIDQITGVEVQGQDLTGDQLNGMRQVIGGQAQQIFGSGEMCATYAPAEGGKFSYAVTLDGVARPELAGEMLWIDADAGWAVSK